jgi:hypothetical protein
LFPDESHFANSGVIFNWQLADSGEKKKKYRQNLRLGDLEGVTQTYDIPQPRRRSPADGELQHILFLVGAEKAK